MKNKIRFKTLFVILAVLICVPLTVLSHGRHFNAEFCKSAGLKIFQMEDDQKLQDLILSIHHCYMQTFSTCTCTKIIENNLGKAYILRV